MYAALYGSWAVAVLVGLDLFRRRQLTLLGPAVLYLAFHVLTFLVRGTWVIASGDWSMWLSLVGRYSEPLVVRVLGYSTLGLVAFWFGYVSPFGPVVSRRLQLPEVRFNGAKIALLSAAFIALGVWSFWRYQGAALFGRGELTLMERTDQGVVYIGATGYLVLANTFIGAILLLWTGLYGFRWWVAASAAPYYFGRLWLGFARVTVFLNILALALVDRARSRRPLLFWAYLISLPLQVWLFTSVGSNRALLREYMAGELDVLGEPVGLTQRSWGDIASFDCLAWVLDVYPGYFRYSYGLQYVDRLLIEPVPRVLWPGKRWLYHPPDPAGVAVPFRGSAPSAVGDFYMTLGPVGVIVGMALVGLLSRVLYCLFTLHRSKAWVATLYCGVVAAYPQFARDGIATAPGHLFFMIGPIVAAVLFCRARKPRAPAVTHASVKPAGGAEGSLPSGALRSRLTT